MTDLAGHMGVTIAMSIAVDRLEDKGSVHRERDAAREGLRPLARTSDDHMRTIAPRGSRKDRS